MTKIVEPSQSQQANSKTVASFAKWAGSNWIVPANIDIEATRAGLSGAPLNAAAITNPSGLDVKIDTFESFIGGNWIGSDDNTNAEHTHTLAGSSTTTTLYLGPDVSGSDTFIFGPSGDFASEDPKVPIVDATDDGSSVTDTDDRRPVGFYPNRGNLLNSTYDDDNSTKLSLDTGTLSETYEQYDVVIYRESHGSSENYQDMRLNGSSAGEYYADFYDSFNNTFDSQDGTTEFGKIAGTDPDGNADETGFAMQILRISCPREIVSNSKHYPTIETVQKGIGKNIDFIFEGHLSVDVAAVDQINVFGGGNATGFIEIRGRGLSHGN